MTTRTGRFTAACLIAAVSTGAVAANAGETWKFGEDASLTVGAGIRVIYRDVDGVDDADVESVRLYTGGQLTKVIGFTFNADVGRDAEGDIDSLRAYDAIARFEFNDYFNVWAGRMVLPVDRANLAGQYYMGNWDFPLVNNFPSYVAGRDNGVAIWGQTGGGKFKYQVGAFQGCSDDAPCSTGSNRDDNPLFAGRLSYAFWDPEPGYYPATDYYGQKEILSIGLSTAFQEDATGTTTDRGDYKSFAIDGLMQKKIATGGVVTLEGSYYYYDTDDKVTPLVSGSGYYVLASYLFPEKIGIGQFQPVAQFQSLDRDDGGLDVTKWEVGTNYIIKGHDARLSAIYSQTDYEGDGQGAIDGYLLGLQLQY
ncbi:porin [Hyphomicrobium sp. CS1GBMeth3]|uniref:porin n=1 Tax=Hyphomicrobium sp. CS1GBMeth3 TaxID=1892845 RepID=UPI00092FE967|nr:porin [Hyphomicrobium sp. CS1GBMeth3]